MKRFFFFIVFIANSIFSIGQSVNGKVTDDKFRPISNVQIINMASGSHIHTDDKGLFVISDVSKGDTLKASHIGFEVQMAILADLSLPIQIIMVEKVISLDEVVISPQINAINLITDIDIQTNPVNSSQDILRQVPGLFIGQHAGGGKAEQIFLRGFDIDHGTDIAITVDGLPVNMVSHAHGQGYADLHFVIPETVDKIDFGQGPYHAPKGNFNTAGYVGFSTKSSLENSLLKIESGQFGTHRLLAMFNLIQNEKQEAYVASEYLITNGPFDSPQNFNRTNLFGKYSGRMADDSKIGIILSHFASDWDASGQIPQREIENGNISRFGAIDDTEGGNTSRTNILFSYDKYLSPQSVLKSSLYYSHYDFTLFSNFTFFLYDPLNGDQIKQQEVRDIFGMNSDYTNFFSYGHVTGSWIAGLNLRNDKSKDVSLAHTLNRKEILDQIQLGDINETNLGIYAGVSFNFGKWTVNPAIRYDYFDFQYNDALLPDYQTQSSRKGILSPKINTLYNYSNNLQLYLKLGKGFHSNDTRVVVARKGLNILPEAYGFDAGFIWKPVSRVIINSTYWYLFLEQEFVYVGDAGIVEPSGKTVRSGIDVSVRYQPLLWLFWNIDANYTHARSTESDSGENLIPLAPDLTFVGGFNIIHDSGFYAGLHSRFISDRPANENYSITARGYFIMDANAGYKWGNFELGFQIQNLFNSEWNETQFATTSRLLNEMEPVEEIHFTPGTPFFIKGIAAFAF